MFSEHIVLVFRNFKNTAKRQCCKLGWKKKNHVMNAWQLFPLYSNTSIALRFDVNCV